MSSTELRCSHKLHGVLDDGIIEIKCRSSKCGHAPGVAVLHRFDAKSGSLLDTRIYKDPRKVED